MTRHLWNMQSWITWVWEYLEFELKESKLLMDILRNYFSLTLRYATAWDVCWRKIICKKLRSFFNLWKFWETISTLFWDMQRPEIFVDIKIFENIWEISNWVRAIFMKILRNNCIVTLRYATNLDVSSHQVVWEHFEKF